MIQKIALLSGLILSASCMVLHQPLPLILGLQYNDNPNYSFSYDVHDTHTGDIKNQHESRRGDTVLGQYSLLQPDGVRRVVDYRADDHIGFTANVNNERINGRINGNNQEARPVNSDTTPQPNLDVYQPWPSANPQSTEAPVAISRSSITQTFSHGIANPWI